eukprot:420498-Heterocapsa_arctica.AAC.1
MFSTLGSNGSGSCAGVLLSCPGTSNIFTFAIDQTAAICGAGAILAFVLKPRSGFAYRKSSALCCQSRLFVSPNPTRPQPV